MDSVQILQNDLERKPLNWVISVNAASTHLRQICGLNKSAQRWRKRYFVLQNMCYCQGFDTQTHRRQKRRFSEKNKNAAIFDSNSKSRVVSITKITTRDLLLVFDKSWERFR